MFCALVSILSSKETDKAETEVDVAGSEILSAVLVTVPVSARSSIVVSVVIGSTSSNASLASESKS